MKRTNQGNSHRDTPSQMAKREEMTPGEMTFGITAAQFLNPSLMFAKGKEMGEISEKISSLNDENSKLREKLKAYKKENEAMNQKVETLESANRKQGETIRTMEALQDKLQKELENVKKAKDQLRIEIEEKTSKSSAENTILSEKLANLTTEFEKVENENKELKRSLEELTNKNNSLEDKVDSIREENQNLKTELGNVKAEQKKIREELDCKNARLDLGQVVWMLEAEIWKVVLPQQKMGRTGILYSMENWLEENSSTEQGKAANKRWEELKRKLKWNDLIHRPAMKILKTLRSNDAHPKNVDLEVARKQLNEGNHVADFAKKRCEEIIDMVVTARNLKCVRKK